MEEHAPPPQLEHPVAAERLRVEGALELLDLLHADLVLGRDQARDASGRETFDEVLTRVDALIVEYRRREAALPPASARHASYAFLLDESGEVHPLPHQVYVALVRGEAAVPQFAGQTLHLAEWYLRLHGDEPAAVANETYALLSIDHEGRADWHATPAPRPGTAAASDNPALPSAAERQRMQAVLFGERPTAPACPPRSGSQ